jgi:hypothetical protein
LWSSNIPGHPGREYESVKALGCGGIFLPSNLRQDPALLRPMGMRIHKHRYPMLFSALQHYTRRWQSISPVPQQLTSNFHSQNRTISLSYQNGDSHTWQTPAGGSHPSRLNAILSIPPHRWRISLLSPHPATAQQRAALRRSLTFTDQKVAREL